MAKDEEQSIGRVLDKIEAEYPSFDCLVIYEGFIDRTVDMAKGNRAMAVSHGKELGAAVVIQTGCVYALEGGYDYIVFCDADAQHDPSDIDRIPNPLLNGEADFVIGSRELGDYIGREPLRLELLRYFCSLVISLLTRKRLSDPTFGFKGWSRWLVKHSNTVYETSHELHFGTTNDAKEILMASRKGLESSRCYNDEVPH